jgi:uncharacterized short protein YbdD (DUF466 family)
MIAGSRKPEAGDVGLLARVNAVVRRIIGAPDYGAYLRHVTEHHPECTPLSEPEFLNEQLTARYSTPGSRCC